MNSENEAYSYRAILIYDGDCPFCSAAATALRRLPETGIISWYHDAAQDFLMAQFDDIPFALAFVDRHDEQVFVGRDAARELCGRAGLPVLIQDLVHDNYELVADAIRTSTGMDRNPDPYHDVLPLSQDARNAYLDLDQNAEGAAVIVTNDSE